MVVQTMEVQDISALAKSVRILANDARRVLRDGRRSGNEADEVLRRIEQMQLECGEAPSSPISLWLENLRRRMEQL